MLTDFSFADILAVLTLFFGGGSLGGFFTWRYTRRKEKAEAQAAEVDMAQKVQDIYQQALADKNIEIEDNRRLVAELRRDRDHYKSDRDELRRRQDELEETVRRLQRDVEKNGRMVESMRQLVCTDLGCKVRKREVMPEEQAETNQTNRAGEPRGAVDATMERGAVMGDIEPIGNDEL